MKLNHILSLALLASSAVNAGAQTVTRAEVRAEAEAAAKAGLPRRGESASEPDVKPSPSDRTRADVSADTIDAARAGLSRGNAIDVPELPAEKPSLTRTQVRAEAIEAARLGLIGRGDREARPPTATELESIRQAGLRAVNEQVSQRAK
jgi:Domain of unknown function (DUF4148)